MKLCPNCRTENDNDAKFCKECASPFPVKAAKSIDRDPTSQSPAKPANLAITSAQEKKNDTPLDFFLAKIKKTSSTSENQPSFWQKAKDSIKGNYYLMFCVALIILVFAILIIGVNSVKTVPTTASSTSSDDLSSQLAPKPIIKVSESDIIEIDSNYLVANNEKYEGSGKYFRVSGKITKGSSYYNHSLSFKTEDGYDLTVDFQSACGLVYYKKDTYVTLVAKYFSGDYNSLNLSDGYIEESGEEAEQTYIRLKGKWDKQREADAKAEKEKAKKAKKEYIASCKTYKYKDIARNPDKYNGKRAKFKGEVVQVIEGYLSTTLRVDVTKGKYGIYTDTMYVVYTPKSSTESRILEDDIITIYGELAGIESYETVMGAKVSIPRINAEYITINSK